PRAAQAAAAGALRVRPAVVRVLEVIGRTVARQGAEGRFVTVTGQGELLEVVRATHAGGRLADLLHGRQEQTDQYGDDGDHHQKFDERKRVTAASESATHSLL